MMSIFICLIFLLLIHYSAALTFEEIQESLFEEPVEPALEYKQHSSGKWLAAHKVSFFGSTDKRIDLGSSTYYVSSSSLAIVVGGFLVSFAIILSITACCKTSCIPKSPRTHVYGLISTILALVSIILLIKFGIFPLQDTVTSSQEDVTLVESILTYFQENLDAVDFSLRDVSLLRDILLSCASEIAPQITQQFVLIDEATAALDGAVDFRRYLSNFAAEIRISDEGLKTSDAYFLWIWVTLIVLTFLCAFLLVSIVLAMEGPDTSKRWMRRTSSYAVLPFLNLTFFVMLIFTAIACFSGVVTSDACYDQPGFLTDVAETYGNFKSEEMAQLEYYLECPPGESNPTFLFLGDAIQSIQNGEANLQLLAGYLEGTGDGPCAGFVDELGETLRLANTIMRVLYNTGGCQTVGKVILDITETVCVDGNGALIWTFLTMFFTCLFILGINVFRGSWQLVPGENDDDDPLILTRSNEIKKKSVDVDVEADSYTSSERSEREEEDIRVVPIVTNPYVYSKSENKFYDEKKIDDFEEIDLALDDEDNSFSSISSSEASSSQ